MTKQEKEQAQQELIAEIFAAFEKIDANIEQPRGCSWVQAKPIVKGSWKYYWLDPPKGFFIKTVLIYPTTYKIMFQGEGYNQVHNCSEKNFIETLHKVIARFCS